MALFGCLWIADFPIWAVLQARPMWRGHPLVVHRGGRIVAMSNEARACGIDPEWALSHAREQVLPLLILPFDAVANADAWQHLLAALYALTPHIEAVREGLCFFEMPVEQEPRRALARLVYRYYAHCGVAAHRAVTELAAYSALAREVRGVRPGREDEFIEGVPLETLSQAGISQVTVQQLQQFGLRWIGQLRGLNQAQIYDHFEDGVLLWHLLRQLLQGAAAESSPIALYEPLKNEASPPDPTNQATVEGNGQSTLSLPAAIEANAERQMSRDRFSEQTLQMDAWCQAARWFAPLQVPMLPIVPPRIMYRIL